MENNNNGRTAEVLEAEIILVINEIQEIETWFSYYDIQTIQYSRDVRVKGKSEIDIQSLDHEAIKKANRLKSLKLIISQV